MGLTQQNLRRVQRALSPTTFLVRLALGVLFVNLFVAALIGWTLYQSWSENEERAVITTQNLSKVLEQNIASSIARFDLALMNVKDEIEKGESQGGMNQQGLKELLERQNDRVPEMDSLRVADAQGDIYSGTKTPENKHFSVKDRPYFIFLRDNPNAGLVISKPLIGRITGDWQVVVARRLNAKDGSFAGVVFAVMTLKYLYEQFSTIHVGPNGVIALRDMDFEILARYPNTKGIGSTVGMKGSSQEVQEFVRAGRTEASYIASPTIDNIERSYTFRKVDNLPLLVFVGLATSDYRAEWWNHAQYLSAVGAVFTLLTLVFATRVYGSWKRQAKAAEALNEAKETAEAANRAKDQFIAVLSHELRTPLTPVLAAVSALKDDPLSVDLRADMEMIHRNVELEARLIDDLLDSTRIGRGKIELHRETIDAHACFRSALEICKSQIEAKHLAVELDLSAPRHYVWADPARLHQVLWNLLSNAVKFTPEHGRIMLRTANDHENLKMEIADTGIGIEADAMQRIFDPFEQGEQIKNRRFGGLGLGLNIARTLIEMHHGSLAATSEGLGKGAAFIVELATVEPVEKPLVQANPSASPAVSPLRILVVEDHADTLQILARFLQKWGHNVTTADSLKSALQLIQEQKFDLLISDLGLPDGTGLEIMQEVKSRYNIPGIALSGYGTEEDIRSSMEAGFSEHLTKPISFQSLQLAIQRIGAESK